MPRVHPVTPVVTADGSSCSWSRPRPRDGICASGGGTRCTTAFPTPRAAGGEFFVSGTGHLVEDASVRATAERAASYDPDAR